MKNILITGHKGLIGSILIDGLKNDYNLYGIDCEEKCIDNFDMRFFNCDIVNNIDLKNTVQQIYNRNEKIDIIIHLAAEARENANWDSIYKNNIIGTKNIYDCAIDFGIKRIILASSTHIYSGYSQYPDKITGDNYYKIKKDSFPKSNNLYGISKMFCENLANHYYLTYGLESIIIRIGSVSSDNKPHNPYHLLYLSHEDLINKFIAGIKTDHKLLTFFAITITPTIFDI
jgi:nucleoside-diphosphate-sugar epimerase